MPADFHGTINSLLAFQRFIQDKLKVLGQRCCKISCSWIIVLDIVSLRVQTLMLTVCYWRMGTVVTCYSIMFLEHSHCWSGNRTGGRINDNHIVTLFYIPFSIVFHAL